MSMTAEQMKARLAGQFARSGRAAAAEGGKSVRTSVDLTEDRSRRLGQFCLDHGVKKMHVLQALLDLLGEDSQLQARVLAHLGVAPLPLDSGEVE